MSIALESRGAPGGNSEKVNRGPPRFIALSMTALDEVSILDLVTSRPMSMILSINSLSATCQPSGAVTVMP